MTERLATTCAGRSLIKFFGGACPHREKCRRYLERRGEYGKDDPAQRLALCDPGKWEWRWLVEEKTN